MALPLIWLGGAVIGAVVLADQREKRKTIESQRRLGKRDSSSSQGASLNPSLWQSSAIKVRPKPGSIVCCFVYGVIEHTAIWLDEHTLIELHGSGLVRAVSTQRFLAGRTGSKIYLACDHRHQPLVDETMLERAKRSIYQYREYDLLDNNCHRFVWACLTNEERAISSFNEFNQLIAEHFADNIYWDEAMFSL
ncbi:lecithin retinol acyltransferase family protein [Shewanella waksmanii]|uniref:lecithin retinol acyltransferase family protein n=1 Tax=Shewanella waksmanii TaxID=213783 RepID=UPI00048FD285|nr:lecithin retinol acyltransferase family protein [Shewanella waksmanii]